MDQSLQEKYNILQAKHEKFKAMVGDMIRTQQDYFDSKRRNGYGDQNLLRSSKAKEKAVIDFLNPKPVAQQPLFSDEFLGL